MTELLRRQAALQRAILAWEGQRVVSAVATSLVDWLEVYGLSSISLETAELVIWLRERAVAYARQGMELEREAGLA